MRALRGLIGLLLLLSAVACALPLGGQRAPGPPRSLRILLTNDDGVGAPGIVELRAALVAAGHEVIVVAPQHNRSGSSVSITTVGRLEVHQVEDDVFAVGGTPSDCVLLGLKGGLVEPPVDMVVAGVNFGQNIGARIVSSGTVGAAITAAGLGVPALASSQTVDFPDYRTTPRFFPDAAAFTASLVGVISASGEDPLLPPGVVLNVNYPARRSADVAGVRLTRQGRSILYSLHYEREADGSFAVSFVPSHEIDVSPDADTRAIAEGYVSVTPLDGSWSADDDLVRQVRTLLRGLETLPATLERGAQP